MRHSSPQFWPIVALGLAFASGVLAQGDPGKSVVKITCRAHGQESVGTGFAWNQPNQVATALHVVAGCKGIEVYSEGLQASTTAKVIKAFTASDLALIQLDKSIGLLPLKLGEQALPDRKHVIWGYPQQVKTMQGDDLRFSRVLKPKSTLADVMSEKTYHEILGAAGYPSLQASVLRIGSTIQPGHSGAPIFDPEGQVVGIGDGGLYEGIKSINWAIPATSLKHLAQSSDPVPEARPKHVAQFSATRPEGAAKDISLPEGGALRFRFTASVEAIAATASDNEMRGLKDLLGEGDNAPMDPADAMDMGLEGGMDFDGMGFDADPTGLGQTGGAPQGSDLRKALLDVYEDPQTGATIAVPQGMKPRLDPKSQMVTVNDAGGRLTLYVQVQNKGGQKASQRFEGYFNKLYSWKAMPDFEEDRIEEFGRIQVEKFLISGDDPQGPAQSLFYSATVNQEDDSFLGSAILAKNLLQMPQQDLQTLQLMEACVELTGFRMD